MGVEYALVMGVFILVFFVLLQYAITGYARRAAESAAEDALAAAAGYRATSSDGEQAGRTALAHVDGGLRDAIVTVTRQDTRTSATVTGQAPQLFPGLPARVSVTLSGPTERFVQ